MPRIYSDQALHTGVTLTLSREASRHIQVLRMQPGHSVQLFDGRGGEFEATIALIGRQTVDVQVGAHHAVERESQRAVHLAVCMPANERMDWLVEKATELGAASITPLMSQRSVVKLSGDRADKKQAHWQAVAVSACEQCGRNRVPTVALPQPLGAWLTGQVPTQATRYVLSLQTNNADTACTSTKDTSDIWVLNGPEGGLSAQEEAQAMAAGWQPMSLGARILRAETAALAALMRLA
ncbi:16S rRNA (uracil(1498)-N(3))-methyltransferase [Comamonadaceae bacterium M7527]|nr:16S rRNA (uracil(1498)-N(3))-methyltransferase [Comamonadaceae bacterium M7527]